MVKWVPAYVKSFVVILSLVPDFQLEDAVVQLDELNVMGLIGPGRRSQVAAPNPQRQADHSYHNGQNRQSNIHSGLTHNILANQICCFQA